MMTKDAVGVCDAFVCVWFHCDEASLLWLFHIELWYGAVRNTHTIRKTQNHWAMVARKEEEEAFFPWSGGFLKLLKKIFNPVE